MHQIVTGAAELFADEILQMEHLTKTGSTQLAADVQYFGNILSAMGFTVSQDLIVIEKSLGMTDEELQSTLNTPNTVGSDVVWKTMAAIRGLDAEN